MDLQNLFRQAQQMQKEMERVRQDLGERIVEGSAGGGKVKVYVTGSREIKAIQIDREVVDPEDVELLEDMIVAAVRDGLQQAERLAEEKMKKITGGMGLPPGFGV